MEIKKGDIFLRYVDEQVYVVEKAAGRVVYLTVINHNESVIHGLAFFKSSLEKYFTKLTI